MCFQEKPSYSSTVPRNDLYEIWKKPIEHFLYFIHLNLHPQINTFQDKIRYRLHFFWYPREQTGKVIAREDGGGHCIFFNISNSGLWNQNLPAIHLSQIKIFVVIPIIHPIEITQCIFLGFFSSFSSHCSILEKNNMLSHMP